MKFEKNVLKNHVINLVPSLIVQNTYSLYKFHKEVFCRLHSKTQNLS